MINLHGDIPAEHRLLANQLIDMELYFDKVQPTDPTARAAAMAYVAMAHDWIEIGLEERAEILFHKAEKVSPGYFNGPIWKDAEDNIEFAYLISAIRDYLNAMILSLIKGAK